MATFEFLLVLVALSLVLQLLAERINLPPAVLFVLGGMAMTVTPGVPQFDMAPDLVLALFLPPLLQLSAYRTDWPVFKSNLGSILLLAVGAVAFTAASVAVVAHVLLPSLPWWAAVALGAIVAPPDAVAASAVLQRFKLPKRLLVVLEGESLINDASSLVLYRFAVAAALAGGASFAGGALQFAATALGGMAIGWLAARAAMWVFARLDNTLLDITLSLLAGFSAYLAAEAVHASGVLGAVVCGLMLGRQQHAEFSAQTRLGMTAVWTFIEFLLSSLVFMLIGLQLRGILERLHTMPTAQLLTLGLAVSMALVISRVVCVLGSAGLARLLLRWFAGRRGDDAAVAPWSHEVVTAWAGMRGVVSIAAALALPSQFPGRDLIVFLAFCAILTTLVLQGTTLGWLIRRLGVSQAEEQDASQQQAVAARAELADAALADVRQQAASPEPALADAAGRLLGEYESRAESVAPKADGGQAVDDHLAQQRVRLSALEAARGRLDKQGDDIDTDSHRALNHELDLEEQRVRRALGEE